MRYPVTIAPTMAQIAVDPGKDATDVESWVNAVFIALILATTIDVKVVASESPVPLYQSGLGFNETVLLDAPHAAFKDLIGAAVNVDHLLSALQRVTISLAVCIDGYGFELSILAGLGRKLAADPANVFEVYGRLGREGKDPTVHDARRYIAYAEILQDTALAYERSDTLNHARELVTRYRRFYRARGYASNAILRPVQAAAEVVLQAEPAHSDPDMLVEEVCGRLIQIDTAIVSGDTQGFTPRDTTYQERYAVMRDFAEYFVYTYYQDALKGRKSSLRGTQFNLLRLACDAVYRDLEASDRSVEPERQPETEE
jgi:CRISPR-associated protein Csc3